MSASIEDRERPPVASVEDRWHQWFNPELVAAIPPVIARDAARIIAAYAADVLADEDYVAFAAGTSGARGDVRDFKCVLASFASLVDDMARPLMRDRYMAFEACRILKLMPTGGRSGTFGDGVVEDIYALPATPWTPMRQSHMYDRIKERAGENQCPVFAYANQRIREIEQCNMADQLRDLAISTDEVAYSSLDDCVVQLCNGPMKWDDPARWGN